MSCPECGFRLDPDNESQVVCPACGADPTNSMRLDDDSKLAAAFEDGEAFAEAPVSLAEVLGWMLPWNRKSITFPIPNWTSRLPTAKP